MNRKIMGILVVITFVMIAMSKLNIERGVISGALFANVEALADTEEGDNEALYTKVVYTCEVLVKSGEEITLPDGTSLKIEHDGYITFYGIRCEYGGYNKCESISCSLLLN